MKGGIKGKVKTSVMLDAGLWRQARIAAAEDGVKPSTVVAESLKAWLADRKKGGRNER
jgi:hypothetical protein